MDPLDLMRIRIQFQIQCFDDQKLKKNLQLGIFILIFLIKNCNLFIPRPPYRTPKLQEKKIQRFKNMKILYFFLFLWVIFALLDPDPATLINADPDPQPWFTVSVIRRLPWTGWSSGARRRTACTRTCGRTCRAR